MFKTTLTKDAFMSNCTACGGNWTAMLMSGIKRTSTELYDAMPNVKYDFVTIGQLVNLICTDNEADADSMMDAFKKTGDDNDHIYWTECLMRAETIVKVSEQAQFLAFLWMFKYFCTKDASQTTEQLKATSDYITKYEAWLTETDGWAVKDEEDEDIPEKAYPCDLHSGWCPFDDGRTCDECHCTSASVDETPTNPKAYARKYLDEYLKSYVDIDVDRVWDAMLEEDDFCNAVDDPAMSTVEIEANVEEYADYVIEENGISAFSNRDPYFFEH